LSDAEVRTTVIAGVAEQALAMVAARPVKRDNDRKPKKRTDRSRIGGGDDRGRFVVITDRFTARVLGSIVLIMTLLIDLSCFIFTKPEISHRPTFPLVVIVPSLPLVAFGVYLLRRASRLKVEDD
jgi:hypothetical protein